VNATSDTRYFVNTDAPQPVNVVDIIYAHRPLLAALLKRQRQRHLACRHSAAAAAAEAAVIAVRRGSLIIRAASGLMAPASIDVTSAFSKTPTTTTEKATWMSASS